METAENRQEQDPPTNKSANLKFLSFYLVFVFLFEDNKMTPYRHIHQYMGVSCRLIFKGYKIDEDLLNGLG